jgi:hypothetical protein
MLRGWQILANSIGRMDQPAALANFEGGIELLGTTGALVANNTVATANNYGIRLADSYGGQACYGPLITNNLLTSNQGNISIAGCPYAQVTYNTIENSSGYGVGLSSGMNTGNYCHYPTLAYNVIYNLTQSADGNLYNGFDTTDVTGGQAFNNTIAQVSAVGMSIEIGTSASWMIVNNIFDCRYNYSVGGAHGCFYVAAGADMSLLIFQNNLYSDLSSHLSYQFEHPVGTMMSFSFFESLTGDVNSKDVTDPLFVSAAAGNFSLQSASPAVGAGVYINGVSTMTAPNIGAK